MKTVWATPKTNRAPCFKSNCKFINVLFVITKTTILPILLEFQLLALAKVFKFYFVRFYIKVFSKKYHFSDFSNFLDIFKNLKQTLFGNCEVLQRQVVKSDFWCVSSNWFQAMWCQRSRSLADINYAQFILHPPITLAITVVIDLFTN